MFLISTSFFREKPSSSCLVMLWTRDHGDESVPKPNARPLGLQLTLSQSLSNQKFGTPNSIKCIHNNFLHNWRCLLIHLHGFVWILAPIIIRHILQAYELWAIVLRPWNFVLRHWITCKSIIVIDLLNLVTDTWRLSRTHIMIVIASQTH